MSSLNMTAHKIAMTMKGLTIMKPMGNSIIPVKMLISMSNKSIQTDPSFIKP